MSELFAEGSVGDGVGVCDERAGESDICEGGVGDDGQPHVTVLRRLERAAQMYQQQLKSGGRAPAIVCNGGGTTHKPKFRDAAGFAVPEAALMARPVVRGKLVQQFWDEIIRGSYHMKIS